MFLVAYRRIIGSSVCYVGCLRILYQRENYNPKEHIAYKVDFSYLKDVKEKEMIVN